MSVLPALEGNKKIMQNKISRWLVAVMATAFVVGGVADAAPKYTRDNNKINIKVKNTKRTEGLKKNTKVKEEVRPQLTSSDVISIEGKATNVRNKQIQVLKLLIEDADPTSKDMPVYLFRLADLYAKKQRYWRIRAMEMYPKIEKNKSNKSALKKKQKLYFKTEKQSLIHALKIYAKLANDSKYKNYPRMDEVLFYYGYTLDSAKRITDSRKIYHQLINNYPDSKYIPQAYLSFADYFFEKDDLDNAENFYDKVLQFPKSNVYNFALYKKGWVYLNQDRPKNALGAFYEVVQRTKKNKKAKTINKAAKKDYVRAYSEVGKADKAYQAFKRVDKKYAFTMLNILGSIYLEQGQARKAIFTYRAMIGIKPKSSDVCEWQGHVVSAMLSSGTQKDKSEAIQGLVKVYQAHKKSKILKGTKLTECRENAQYTSGEMAKIWHVEAIKTLNPKALANVEGLYKLYVKTFTKAKDLGEMKYYYADLLWQRAEYEKNPRVATDKWERAAIAFTNVVESGTLKGAQLQEAAKAAVLGWKNALQVDPRTKAPRAVLDEKAEKAEIPKPREIGSREKKMISAFDVYIKYIKDPSDDELVMMKFLRARIFWRYDRLEEANPFFYEIIKKHPGHETALYSANILLDSLIRLKQYNEMNKMVKKLLANKKLMEDEDLKERLTRIEQVGMRKEAEQLEKDGQHIACGKAYLEIYYANENAEGTDQVLYNGGVCFENGKSIGLAIQMFTLLDKKFPNSNLNKKALVRIGSAYASIARYKAASEKYEEYARRFGGEKDAAGALQNAVTYRKGIGMDKEAIANIENFVGKYKKKMKNEASAALFGLAGIYENQGNDEMVIKSYKKYMSVIGKSGGADRMLAANARIGEILWKQSCKKTKNGACVEIQRERATRRRGKKRRSSGVPTQCGDSSKIKLKVVSRDKRKAKEAMKHFKAAMGWVSKGAIKKTTDEGRKAVAIYWMAATRFYMQGGKYESYLSLKFPAGMDFDRKKKKKFKESTKRFSKWFEQKSKLAAGLNKEFDSIKNITGGGAAWAVAAAARIGQVTQNFSDALFTAEIPKIVRTGPYAMDRVDAYCDRMTTTADPLEKVSLAAYGFCLNLSTKLNWFNDWSRLCEEELGQINPNDYPTATEFHGPSDSTSQITDVQNLITEIAE